MLNFKFLLLLCLFVVPPTNADTQPLSKESIPGATTISSYVAKAMHDDHVIFIDVRSDRDWEASRIPHAIHLAITEGFFTEESLLNAVKDKTTPIIIYCNGPQCHRSEKAVEMAVEWGFRRVYYFREGFPSWLASGYPVE